MPIHGSFRARLWLSDGTNLPVRRYVKQESDDCVLTVCLVAWATNTGLSKMGELSDIEYHTLAAISANVIRPETLTEANDRVSNAIEKLSIFRHYDIGETIHSSSDGQKFETRIHTINTCNPCGDYIPTN